MNCNIEYIDDILSAIQDFLYIEKEKDIENLEAYVKREIPEIASEFSLASYLANSETFKEDFEDLLVAFNLEASDYIQNLDSSKIKTKSNVSPNLSSNKILDLFHTLPLVKANFESFVTNEVIRNSIIGKSSDTSYVSSNTEISNNFTELKNSLFREIQNFLKLNTSFNEEVIDLYNSNRDIINYDYYKRVMNLLDNYFFSGENFSLIETYSNKNGIPNLSVDNSNKDVIKAYNAGIFLSNFDSVLQLYFSGILDINYNLFNNLRTSLGESDKYKLKIESIKVDYWLRDTHMSEGSENSESKLVKLLVSTIPIYNKKNEKSDTFMEMKDFYLLAAQISDFEIEFGNRLKNAPNSNYIYFNENSSKALLWYLDEITKAINNEPGSNSDFKKIFGANSEIVQSLKNYIESSDLNILEKEKNSDTSILNIFSQIINNNFGASYTVYNAKGKYNIKEVYKQNFNNIQVQSYIFNKLAKTSNKKVYNVDAVKADVEKLFEGLNSVTDMKTITREKKVQINTYIKNKSSINISYLGFDDLVDILQQRSSKLISGTEFKHNLISFLTALNEDYNSILEKIENKEIAEYSYGDSSVSEFIPTTIKNSFFLALRDAYLLNYVAKPMMNISTLSGEKLPAFKVATLTQKDLELFELQRNFEKNNQGISTFRSLLIKDSAAILGTGTKLELVNKGINKSATDFNISENYISDFQFDFLQNIIDNDRFSIMLGNYSDKNTILTKIINGKFEINGTSVLTLSQKDLLNIVKIQGLSFYKDTLWKIFRDYEILLNIKLSKSIEANIEKINKILENIDIRTLSKSASDNNINLSEELHYSRYMGKTSLNQLLVDYYRIFSNTNLFNKFVDIQEKEMLNKFKQYNKNIGNDVLRFSGTINITEAVKKLGLEDTDFDKEKKENSEEFIYNYYKLEGSKGINPLLKKWMWTNALFRNEYMFISGKGEYMHPHKLRGNLSYRGTSKEVNFEEMQKEMSGRLITMAKRNVMFTATIEVPIRKSKLGVPEDINIAAMDDFTTPVFNIAGETKNQDAHDGSSFMNYVYSLMLDNSFPAKGYTGTKKQFGTFITEHGVVIKKDAESVITNSKILESKNSTINYRNKQKQSLSIPVKALDMSLRLDFNNDFFFNNLGKQFKINTLIIENNTYKMVVSEKVDNEWIISPEPIKGTFTNLFDLWEAFGGEYSTDEEGVFNEGSNDLLYKVVTSSDKKGNYPLKDKMIHVISNVSALKAGATNVNSIKSWSDSEDLAYFSFKNRFLGIQLDASHEADESQVKEVTQVISALAQNAETAHLAEEAYQDIANVIKKAMHPYLRYIKPGENINKSDLYRYLAERFVKTIENSKGDTIAKVLIHAFSRDVNIPFSNQNFFTPFVRDIITKMNNEFITRYYSGTGAILIPSHGMIQLYDIPIKNELGEIVDYRVATQKDIIKEALNNFDESKFITKEDKIIYGHNGIGKSFLFGKGKSEFISLDDDFKPIQDAFIETHKQSTETNQDYKARHPEEYNIFLLDLWEKTKAEAKLQGKKAIVSNHHILRQRAADFDKIFMLDSPEFQRRLIQRGSTQEELDKIAPSGQTTFDEWKNNLDAAAANADPNKVVVTKKYLSDLVINNNEDLISSYLKYKLPNEIVTWDKIELGDTILLPLTEEIKIQISGEMAEIIDSEAGSFMTEEQTSQLAQAIEDKYRKITLLSPELYYKYKQPGKALITKVINKPRDLKPSQITFNDGEFQKNIFDLDSIRLRYKLENLVSLVQNNGEIDTNDRDFLILKGFYKYITERDFLTDIQNNSLFVKKHLGNILNNWTQRNLDLLAENRIMVSATPENIETLFNGDRFGTIFDDAKVLYNHLNTKSISNYKFKAAELILGDIYKSKFNRNSKDSLYDIYIKGKDYFQEILSKDYENDDTTADIKINLSNHDRPIYIKYVDTLPGNDYKLNLTLENLLEEDGIKNTFVRRNDKGEIIYSFSDYKNINAGVENGREVIYIKAIATIHSKNNIKHYDKEKSFYTNLDDVIKSFKDNIRSVVPLMNNPLGKATLKEDSEGNLKSSKLTFDNITLDLFSRISEYTLPSEKPSQTWLKKYKNDILQQLSNKMFASWQKSHEFISARIPAQSLQSFMEMKNIAYMEGVSNDAYVSIWQIWLQGSDFDIDKSYMLGSGFSANGQFDSWSALSNYSSIEQLNALEKLPLPINKKTILSKDRNTLNLTVEFDKFFALDLNSLKDLLTAENPETELDKLFKLRELSTQQIKVINEVLRKIKNYSKNLSEVPVFIGNLNEENKKLFISLINKHNLNTNYLKSNHAVKNSIVAKIKQIISNPSSQLLANIPISIDDWHTAVKEVGKNKVSKEVLLSSYDMFSMYKQQRDASVGKKDVGIAANGLKSFFALSSYYNRYYSEQFPTNSMDLRRSNKTFKKSFTFIDSNNIEMNYNLGTIADIKINKAQQKLLEESIGKFSVLRTKAALALSGFTSAATDNAKELLMAKVNAVTELASMHIYLLMLGLSINEVVTIMTSPVIETVIEHLENNLFFEDKTTKVNMIFNTLEKEYKENPILLNNVKILQDIYQGAQEAKLLSAFLGANQKTSANIEQINRYLNNFETAIYSRENQIFGRKLSNFEFWRNYSDSKDIEKMDLAKTKLEELTTLIFENNKQLDSVKDLEYVKDILNRAKSIEVSSVDYNGNIVTKNVSILGGQFNFKHYINPDPRNDNYRKLTKEYYNLIKNTFNIFDIIDEVPHFKQMIEGIILSHNLLLNSSVKYNSVFDLAKDIIRNNSFRIVNEDNAHIKNQMGNSALPTLITPITVQKILAGIDMRLKIEWLKSENTSNLTFNVTELIRTLNEENEKLGKTLIKDFAMYTSDEARNENLVNLHSKKVNAEDTEDTIISLNTNYGIANFKLVMEEILLPLLQTRSNILSDSLNVSNVYNPLGLRTSAIVSSFSLSELSTVVAKEKAQKLTKAFNNLDIENETRSLVKNANGNVLKWRDLFYVYNLLINNERYGDKRLTPLFEDYSKERSSLGYDYIIYSAKIDSGELNLFDLEKALNNDPNYINAVNNNDSKTKVELENVFKEELENDFLFYALQDKGKLYVNSNKKNTVLTVTNGNFVAISNLTETEEMKKGKSQLSEIFKLLKDRGFIINFKC